MIGRSLVRQILLLLVLLAGSAIANAADNRDSYPKQFSVSPKGVNIQTGRFSYQQVDLGIGPLKMVRSLGDGALYYGVMRRFGLLANSGTRTRGWTHNYASGISVGTTGGVTYHRVTVDGTQYMFKALADGTLAPGDAGTQGMTLYSSGGQTIMVDHSGNQYTFITHPAAGNPVVLQRALYANGSAISITYTSAALPKLVSSNMGYAIIFDFDGSQNVSAACGFNTAQTYVDSATTCAGAAMKVSYGYDASGSRLMSVTDTAGGVTSYSYAETGTGAAYLVSCISLVNSATCALQNSYGDQPGDPLVNGFPCCTKRDQVRVQTTATGNVWRYNYEPAEDPNDVPQQQCWPYWAGADMTDPGGGYTGVNFDRGYLIHVDAPEGITDYRYPNGCTTGSLGTALVSIEVRLPKPTLVRKPGGIREYYEYDLRGNVTRRVIFPIGAPDPLLTNGGQWVPSDPDLNRCCLALGTPAIPAGSQVFQTSYLASYWASGTYGQAYAFGCGVGPSDAKLCNKPQSVIDAAGYQTDYTYDPAHGGVLIETAPAVGGISPQTRYTYVQRQAWVKASGGGYSPTGDNIWLLASKSICKSGAASGAGCALGSVDEVRTLYDYGPNSGPNNLLLRGVVSDATGIATRTCFGYDWQGNKISETEPRAGLTSCP